MEINFKHIHTIRVRYSETDKMGYCYYGNYASFLEVGRVEAMRSRGVSYRSFEENGVMMPVLEFSIKYFLPAKYDDLLFIHTIITKIEGTRIYFEYEIFNETDKKIIAAQTTLVFVSANTMKPIPAPKEFLDLFTIENEDK
jgi:acyl-CoA thioester hydrolase